MDIVELLGFSYKSKASDLHLSAGMPPMIRVHGDVKKINLPPMEHKDVHKLTKKNTKIYPLEENVARMLRNPIYYWYLKYWKQEVCVLDQKGFFPMITYEEWMKLKNYTRVS